MSDVPNTTTFSLFDVLDAVYGSHSSGNLSSAFTASNSAFFDATYGSKTMSPKTMLGFRNYHDTNKPTVTTYPAFMYNTYTEKSVQGLGEVLSIGGSAVTTRGLCWSTSPNPTLSDAYTSGGSGIGAYAINTPTIASVTTWHFRAYATNSYGTSYGEDRTAFFYAVGDAYLGGIVGYVQSTDQPTFDPYVQHGIIIDIVSSSQYPWSLGSTTYVTGTSTAIYTGDTNTATIVSALGAGSYPAKLCSDAGYYLASIYDLDAMFVYFSLLGIYGTKNFWSSSEVNKDNAYSAGVDSVGHTSINSNGKIYNEYYIGVHYF